jgi:hypothetical protein
MHIEEVSLRHELTDRELAQLAKGQANAIEKKTAAEGELGAIKKDYAGRIALAQAEVSNISQRVNAGWEMRSIKCLLIDERPEGYRLIVRTDNGHIAKRRKLNPEERQMKLVPPEEQRAERPLVASALLKVDDPDWHDADMAQVTFYEDEVEALRGAQPPVEFVALNPRGTRQIEAAAADAKKRGRKEK